MLKYLGLHSAQCPSRAAVCTDARSSFTPVLVGASLAPVLRAETCGLGSRTAWDGYLGLYWTMAVGREVTR